MSTENKKAAKNIIIRAWKDASFKNNLMQDPNRVASEMGLQLPKEMNLKVVEETENTTYLVIPRSPVGSELSDEALERIAGGVVVLTISGEGCD